MTNLHGRCIANLNLEHRPTPIVLFKENLGRVRFPNCQRVYKIVGHSNGRAPELNLVFDINACNIRRETFCLPVSRLDIDIAKRIADQGQQLLVGHHANALFLEQRLSASKNTELLQQVWICQAFRLARSDKRPLLRACPHEVGDSPRLFLGRESAENFAHLVDGVFDFFCIDSCWTPPSAGPVGETVSIQKILSGFIADERQRFIHFLV